MWELVKKDKIICRSWTTFSSEIKCRSDIARARKSMPGAKFAKVEVQGE